MENYTLSPRQPEADIPKWARFVSFFFSPLLIPTYCVALVMWLTPLSALSENTRLGVTFIVFLVTAAMPFSFRATYAKVYRDKENRLRAIDTLTTVVMIVSQLICGFYLYYLHAPAWMVLILVGAAVSTSVFLIMCRLMRISGYTFTMGTLTAVIIYLSHFSLLEVPATGWIMGAIVLSGLVGSAGTAASGLKLSAVALGYFAGAAIMYGVLSLYVFI